MTGTNRIRVRMQLNDRMVDVGELIAEGKKIYFRYDPAFIALGLDISPFKLPLQPAIVSAEPVPFDGLFGVFSDSLPDGWGRLLLDRTLTTKGISIGQITPLDRLAYVGTGGMGSLIYEPAFDADLLPGQLIELDLLAGEMRHVLEGASSDMMDELYSLGGSSGGARPKIFVGYNTATDHMIHGADELPAGYEHWIIKFPSSFDRVDVAHIEYAYYQMALDAGIEMMESRLFKGASGKYYFGTKRFDRIGNRRLHMHSSAGLLHDNFRLSNLDYGHLMDAAFRLEKHVGAYEKLLRLAAFNVYSHNRDDHSKNFSFLMEAGGTWQFAPAYDLTFSNASHGFQSTMVAGESQSPGRKHLLKLAKHFSMKHPERIIEQVQSVLSGWDHFAQNSGVGPESRQLIGRTIAHITD